MAVGRRFGSMLIAKPKRNSCISGMPRIMAKVSRSRRSWTNSLRSGCAYPARGEALAHARLPLKMDEDVLQAWGVSLMWTPARPR